MTVPIVVVLAAAKTSTGAPWVIWAASVSDPPYDGTTFTPGFACSKFFASVVNAAFSDEAANTTTVPDAGDEVDDAAFFEELHAAIPSATSDGGEDGGRRRGGSLTLRRLGRDPGCPASGIDGCRKLHHDVG